MMMISKSLETCREKLNKSKISNFCFLSKCMRGNQKSTNDTFERDLRGCCCCDEKNNIVCFVSISNQQQQKQ